MTSLRSKEGFWKIVSDPFEIVISSSSEGKIGEIREILEGLPVRLLTKAEVGGWPEIEETGSSYLENARLKAVTVLQLTGHATLADDSGIEVDALNGAPGIRSARFAREGATDDENNAKLVAQLSGVPDELRTARYRCVVVLAFPDGTEISGTGTCEGRIGTAPRGSGGFGYDPWFIPQGETRTMAELSSGEKHAISHRGAALRDMASQLEKRLSQQNN